MNRILAFAALLMGFAAVAQVENSTAPTIEILAETTTDVSVNYVVFEIRKSDEEDAYDFSEEEYSFDKVVPIDELNDEEERNGKDKKKEDSEALDDKASIKAFMLSLETNGFQPILTLEKSGSYMDYYNDEAVFDSILEVRLNDASEMDLFLKCMSNFECSVNMTDIEFNPLEENFVAAYPILTAQAKEKGESLAASLGYQLGGIVHCTNVLPQNISQSMISRLNLMNTSIFDSYIANPFDKTESQRIVMVYTFELVEN